MAPPRCTDAHLQADRPLAVSRAHSSGRQGPAIGLERRLGGSECRSQAFMDPPNARDRATRSQRTARRMFAFGCGSGSTRARPSPSTRPSQGGTRTPRASASASTLLSRRAWRRSRWSRPTRAPRPEVGRAGLPGEPPEVPGLQVRRGSPGREGGHGRASSRGAPASALRSRVA